MADEIKKLEIKKDNYNKAIEEAERTGKLPSLYGFIYTGKDLYKKPTLYDCYKCGKQGINNEFMTYSKNKKENVCKSCFF